MKIAFVHPSYPGAEGSGAVYSATAIATGLRSRGHDVTVYCLKDPSDDDLADPHLNYKTIADSVFDSHPYLHANRALRTRQAEFEQYDVLHSYLPRTIATVAEIGTNTGVATVNTLNGYGGVCPKNDLLYKGVESCGTRGSVRCANCVLQTEHEALKYKLSDLVNIYLTNSVCRWSDNIDRYHIQATHVGEKYKKFGFKSEKLTIVPNILDKKFMIEHQGSFSEPYQLLYIGRLQRSKGTDRLIQTFATVTDELSAECELTLVGPAKGDFEAMLREQASELGVREQITFMGRVEYDCIPEIYATHDLYVYPGRWDEPFARVFLEAMATGTPVVSTNVGGVEEILDTAGVVATDQQALSETIVETLRIADLKKLSANGKRRASKFTPDVIIPQFETLYEEAKAE